jgi:hypothetical protein
MALVQLLAPLVLLRFLASAAEAEALGKVAVVVVEALADTFILPVGFCRVVL